MTAILSEDIYEPVVMDANAGPRELNSLISHAYTSVEHHNHMLQSARASYSPQPGTFRYIDLILSRFDIGFAVAYGFEDQLWEVLCSPNNRTRSFLLSMPTPSTANAVLMRNQNMWSRLIRSRFDFVVFASFANSHSDPTLKRKLALFLLQTLENSDLGFADTTLERWRLLLSSMLVSHSILPQVELQRPLKLAVLISGQIRQSFTECFAAMQNAMPETIEADFYLSTWAKTGISKRAAAGETSEKELSADLLESTGLARQFKKVELEDEDQLDFTSNQAKQHYKIWRCFELAERANGYDLCLRIRPDFMLERAIPTTVFHQAFASQISPYALLSVGGQMVRSDVHSPYLYMSDNIALGRPGAYAAYAETWTSQDQMRDMFPQDAPKDWYGHVSLCCALLAKPVLVTTCTDFPPYRLL